MKAEIEVAQNIFEEKFPASITTCLQTLRPMEAGFKGLIRIFSLALTFPVSNAACERSFSTLKLTKSYLRSTMSENRLNSLTLLSVHKDLTQKLDFEKIVDRFSLYPLVLPNMEKDSSKEPHGGKRIKLHI